MDIVKFIRKWNPLFIGASVLIIIGVIGILFINTDYVCSDCYEIEGNLSAIKKSGHIVVDGQDYFISDWFNPDGSMPYYVNDYIGHRVHIDYVAGCGRTMITNIEVMS